MALGSAQGAIFPLCLSLNTQMLDSKSYTRHIPANVPKWNLSIQGNPPLPRVHPILCRHARVLLIVRQDPQKTTYNFSQNLTLISKIYPLYPKFIGTVFAWTCKFIGNCTILLNHTISANHTVGCPLYPKYIPSIQNL